MDVLLELLVGHAGPPVGAQVLDLVGIDLRDVHVAAFDVSPLPIGYRGRGDAHHHGDLVQPEPMAAIGEPQREPHRILGVFYRVRPVGPEVAVAEAPPSGSALVADAEASLGLADGMARIQIIEHLVDKLLRIRHLFLLENYFSRFRGAPPWKIMPPEIGRSVSESFGILEIATSFPLRNSILRSRIILVSQLLL